ncbi:DUF554 domain-containing protein [Peptoanaerobacter stomatis]|uniref:DUF554 domain-containing protein n=1 Tax=Peptoanaerobacter stomatis TaxID=796937 RepID=UPI003F9FDE8C
MIYNLLNGLGILVGSIIGLLLSNGIPERVSNSLMKAMGLVVLYIGIETSLSGKNISVIVISLAIGTIIGEILEIDNSINKFGKLLENKIAANNENSKFSEGFVTTSILFCAGAMGIVGSLQAGLNGSGDTLLAKTLIDGIVACIFTTSLGYGVIFSALSVILYQGIFVLLAVALSNILGENIIDSISAVGGIIILGMGINLLTNSNIKVANMVLSIFIPIIFGFFKIP